MDKDIPLVQVGSISGAGRQSLQFWGVELHMWPKGTACPPWCPLESGDQSNGNNGTILNFLTFR